MTTTRVSRTRARPGSDAAVTPRPRDDVMGGDDGHVVSVDQLGKRYGDVVALDGVTFQAGRGEVLGILGPNGAGKTTLVEILEGLRRADRGSLRVLGATGAHRPTHVRAAMGIVMQASALPQLLTVAEVLRLYASLYERSRPVDELVDLLGLEDKQSSQVRHLSGGQSQRVAVALALVGHPRLLFLDEPTSGLDPQARRAVWELIADAQSPERCVILTTHQMDEAEHLCSRVAIVDHGRILDLATPSELVDRHCPGYHIHFRTHRGTALTSLPGDATVDVLDPAHVAVSLRVAHLEHAMAQLMAERASGRVEVEDLRVERANLEDVFIALTGREIRND
jgi:ABC-2 type transport system ATP-binding protein